MTPAWILGIDPGKAGGLAVLTVDGTVAVAMRMPATERDLLEAVQRWAGGAHAVLELVRASPQMGVVSAFTFGQGLGAIRMALTATAIPFTEVSPLKWQRLLGCLSGGDKQVTKARAQELFPRVVVTHYIADALLLAEYGRRQGAHVWGGR